MPPHAAAFSDHAIDEAQCSIEVETDGKFVVSKIIVVGPNQASVVLPPYHSAVADDDDDEDNIVLNPITLGRQLESQEEAYFYETLSDNLMNACTACTSSKPEVKPRKSALKKPSSTFKSSSQDRTVGFNALKIREYALTLGDHPSASSGPPMTLDWTPTGEEKIISVDQYEQGRQPRRSRRALKMSYQKREAVLEAQGFTMDQVRLAWEESLKVRKQRHETILQGAFSTKVEEACQSAARKFWRTLNYA